ncbi:MAG TPA: DUF983 domain-containing protein [Caulobacterales bacterium]|jgi:uncharacterized protein (DUF983 family)|nr:DUF983 domain-containing protein [Caulobacterales bacterium]
MTGRAPSPYLSAILARCPNCGKGKLFRGFLTFAPACSVCGVGFGKADVGDGAAVFVMFIVGAVVVPLAFILQFKFVWDAMATLAVSAAAAIALSLLLLRPVKALLFTLQFKHKAAEGHLTDE